jgi:predicted nucleic acid-binding protein
MKTNVAFWDSSALMLLCLNQLGSSRARRYARELPGKFVWWGASVEVESALWRLHGKGDIGDTALKQARHTWQMMRGSLLEVQPRERVRELAEDAPRKYGLRALDSFQLAAALAWCSEKPRHRAFVTFDARLGQAARKAGFSVYG